QMLMRPRMVVPGPKLHQLHPQIIAIHDGDAIELLLERAKEPLGPSVLPGAVQCRGLQTNAQASQRGFHHARVEARLVVHPDAARQTEVPESVEKLPAIPARSSTTACRPAHSAANTPATHDRAHPASSAVAPSDRPCRSGPSPTPG